MEESKSKEEFVLDGVKSILNYWQEQQDVSGEIKPFSIKDITDMIRQFEHEYDTVVPNSKRTASIASNKRITRLSINTVSGASGKLIQKNEQLLEMLYRNKN